MCKRALRNGDLAALAAAAMLALGGCSGSLARGAETSLARALISPDEENQIGLQVKGELEQKQKVVYLSDPAVVSYVRDVAGRVIAIGKRDRPDVKWEVNVIDDPKTVNAFATPGGYLYVYSGLIAAADDEAQLAGVMAHETGHVVARHAARNMVTAYGIEAVTSLVAGDNPGLLRQVATGVASQGLLLKHSRGEETEADEYGARYASAAGYNPYGLVTFFQRLEAQEGSIPGALVFLSDHPATPERVEHILRYIGSHRLSGADTGAERFAPMRARLAALPPSAAPPPPAAAPPPPPPPPPR
jgi:predicted Zn-dependent protease